MATELSSIFLLTQRAGEGGCDVTGRVKKNPYLADHNILSQMK